MDEATLENLADLICGDSQASPVYRTGVELTRFFERAGLPRFRHDGSTRRLWTLDALRDCNSAELESVIKRIASPREYGGDPEKIASAIRRLNQILVLEGLKIKLDGIESKIVPLEEPVTYRLGDETELIPLPPPDFTALGLEPGIGDLLRLRWDEAQRCVEAGVHLAAIVMMGGLLEGILLGVLRNDPQKANQSNATPKDPKTGKARTFREWSLQQMIEVAHDVGWLGLDVKKFSHSLREFRNLIHPYEQLITGAIPDEDTCNISWLVVQAAVNDLARVLIDPDDTAS